MKRVGGIGQSYLSNGFGEDALISMPQISVGSLQSNAYLVTRQFMESGPNMRKLINWILRRPNPKNWEPLDFQGTEWREIDEGYLLGYSIIMIFRHKKKGTYKYIERFRHGPKPKTLAELYYRLHRDYGFFENRITLKEDK